MPQTRNQRRQRILDNIRRDLNRPNLSPYWIKVLQAEYDRIDLIKSLDKKGDKPAQPNKKRGGVNINGV